MGHANGNLGEGMHRANGSPLAHEKRRRVLAPERLDTDSQNR
ncbi:MAG: hypothetical protein ACFCUG_08615 [Thiotrichales bacterium]